MHTHTHTQEDKVSKVFQERRDGLTAVSPVSLARLLAAKDNLLSVTKTNDISVRGGTQCAINRVLIGKVMLDRSHDHSR